MEPREAAPHSRLGSDVTDVPSSGCGSRKWNLARVCDALGKADGPDPDSSFSALFSLDLPAILRRNIDRHHLDMPLRILRGERDYVSGATVHERVHSLRPHIPGACVHRCVSLLHAIKGTLPDGNRCRSILHCPLVQVDRFAHVWLCAVWYAFFMARFQRRASLHRDARGDPAPCNQRENPVRK